MIVTTKARSDVLPDLEQAERLGILVMTKENIEQALDQTLTLQNADQIYEEAEATIRSAKQQYETQGVLPISSQYRLAP
jgi:hypothetical protein